MLERKLVFRVFTSINLVARTTRGFPETPVLFKILSNKQVVKLAVHLLLRVGNKAVKLRDTPATKHARNAWTRGYDLKNGSRSRRCRASSNEISLISPPQRRNGRKGET